MQKWLGLWSQEDTRKQKKIGTEQDASFLAYADYIRLFGGNINFVKKDITSLLDVSKEVSLQVNTLKKVSTYWQLITRLQDKLITQR